MKNITHMVLGVDPGFSVTGYSLLCYDGNRVRLQDCGYLKMNSKFHLSKRTGQFYEFFKHKIDQNQPNSIALETSFLGKNAQTFLKLGYLRGILYLLADQHKLDLIEYAPREVKSALTGFGGASKDQVASVILRFFPRLQELSTIERHDVTDSLAIALCGLWQQMSNKNLTSCNNL